MEVIQILYLIIIFQGLRNEMEDTICIKKIINSDKEKIFRSYFSLFDGHNGIFSSEFASRVLLLLLVL